MSSHASSKNKPASATQNLKTKIDAWLGEILESYKPRHVRDNKVIRDAVFGFNIFYQHEINLIDSPLLQRLRYIHQTALAMFAYPTACHSRFDHSLGCAVVADRMMRSLNNKKSTLPFGDVDRAEIRLAALLHDCGHGPFSHASEFVYDTLSPELQNVRMENMAKFGEAAGHEILSYFIVTSKKFSEELWGKVCGLYGLSEKLICKLLDIDWERVGSMILGQSSPLYLAQMVNGPFDADKFDYIIRDGYFSGLTTSVDIDRLAVSLDLHEKNSSEPKLCMDIGGATVLEQLLFNKMILFSSMYHHHKVRASFRQLVRIFTIAMENGKFFDLQLCSAADFLRLDDFKVFSFALKDSNLCGLAEATHNRQLPKRALVIDRTTLKDIASREKWVEIRANFGKINNLENKIASKAKVSPKDICIDFPPEPRIFKTAQTSMVRIAPERPLVPLDSLYPVAGWMAGYQEYKFRSYIFSTNGSQKKVAQATCRIFRDEGILLDSKLSKQLAKW